MASTTENLTAKDLVRPRRGGPKIRESRGYKIFTVCNYTFLALLALSMVLPFLHILAKSLSGGRAIAEGQVWFWPVEFQFSSYESIFAQGALPRALMVTVFVTLVGTFISVVLTAMMAYPLARTNLRGRGIIMFLVVFTMLIGVPMIPSYLLVRTLGLLDTVWALILPGAVSAFNLILVRTFFQGLPTELLDAARIDGCTEWRILWRIVVPLSVPVLVTVGLFYAVVYWNTYQAAILYIQDPSLFTLQVVLRNMIVEGDMANATSAAAGSDRTLPESLKSAAIIFATVPILCVYPFLQRYFIRGSLLGSVKG